MMMMMIDDDGRTTRGVARITPSTAAACMIRNGVRVGAGQHILVTSCAADES